MKIEVLAATLTISIVLWIVILFYSKIAFMVTIGLLLVVATCEVIRSAYHLIKWISKIGRRDK